MRRRAAAVGKPLSYRCVQDAMAAARDGDVILVERGHHNVAGTTIEVNKRVLIRCGPHRRGTMRCALPSLPW